MDEKFILELDRYERDNLIALLKVIYSGKVGPLDTGDWCGQIYWRLTNGVGYDAEVHNPNIRPEIQIDYVKRAWEHRLKKELVELKDTLRDLLKSE